MRQAPSSSRERNVERVSAHPPRTWSGCRWDQEGAVRAKQNTRSWAKFRPSCSQSRPDQSRSENRQLIGDRDRKVRGYHQGSCQAWNTLTIIQPPKGYREWTRHAPCRAGPRAQKQGRYRSHEGYQELERDPTLPWIESERPENKNHWSLRKSCRGQEEGSHGSSTRRGIREEGREEGVVFGRP